MALKRLGRVTEWIEYGLLTCEERYVATFDGTYLV